MANLRSLRARLTGNGFEFGATTVVAGVAANTDLHVTGITKKDLLLAVLQFPPPNDTGTVGCINHTATSSITSDGHVQSSVATNDPANSVVVIMWLKCRANW